LMRAQDTYAAATVEGPEIFGCGFGRTVEVQNHARGRLRAIRVHRGKKVLTMADIGCAESDLNPSPERTTRWGRRPNLWMANFPRGRRRASRKNRHLLGQRYRSLHADGCKAPGSHPEPLQFFGMGDLHIAGFPDQAKSGATRIDSSFRRNLREQRGRPFSFAFLQTLYA